MTSCNYLNNSNILKKSFYHRDTVTVAKNLLGKKLVRKIDNIYMSGIIVETEAYIGEYDSACHAYKGRTKRTEIMFKDGGLTYIYLIYGMYNMLNIVTEKKDFPAAVLIRALEPLSGIDLNKKKHPSNGPGKLCRTLAIDRTLNGIKIYNNDNLWIENFKTIDEKNICEGERIGISYALPKDKERKWRFWIKNNPHVSTYKKNR
jgi:DNA-3-methyladenine glycosylase